MHRVFVAYGLNRVPNVPATRIREALALMHDDGWRQRRLRRTEHSMRSDRLAEQLIRFMPDLAPLRTGTPTQQAAFDRSLAGFEAVLGQAGSDGIANLILAWNAAQQSEAYRDALLHTALACHVPVVDLRDSNAFSQSPARFVAWIGEKSNLATQAADNLERSGLTQRDIDLARRNIGLLAALHRSSYGEAANTMVAAGALAAEDRLVAAAQTVDVSAGQLGEKPAEDILEEVGQIVAFPGRGGAVLSDAQSQRLAHARTVSERVLRDGSATPTDLAQIMIPAEEVGGHLLGTGTEGAEFGYELVWLASGLSQCLVRRGLLPVTLPVDDSVGFAAAAYAPAAAPARLPVNGQVQTMEPPLDGAAAGHWTVEAAAAGPAIATLAVRWGLPYRETVQRLLEDGRLLPGDPRAGFARREHELDGYLLPESLLMRLAEATDALDPTDAEGEAGAGRPMAVIATQLRSGEDHGAPLFLEALSAAERLALPLLADRSRRQDGEMLLALTVSLCHSMIVRSMGRAASH
ncbi:MAG: hypothetical protein AAGG06_03510 [Pseudomonadota bacterium]